MASILTGGPNSPGVNLYSLLFGSSLKAGPAAGTETSYAFSLPGSLFVTVTGSAFTYDETGALTGGTIETYTFKDAAGRTLAAWNPADAGVPFVKTVWSFGGSALIDVFLKEEDTIVGSAFGDYLVAGLGNDTVDGGAGRDELMFGQDGRKIGMTVDLNDGNAADAGGRAWSGPALTPPDPGEIDTLISIESIWATEHADLLIGDAQDNAFTPGLGSDTVDGGGGYDEIGFTRDGRAAGVTVDLDDGNAGDVKGRAWSGTAALPPNPGSGEIDVLTSIESVWATHLADRLIGDARDNGFTPGLGSDTIQGGLGRDEIYYNRDGRAEGISVDLVDASADDEVGRIWTGSSPTPPASGEIDEVTSIESVWATILADRLDGDSRGTSFTPDAGDDTIHGGLGEDVLDYLRGSVAATAGLVITFSGADGGTVHQDGRGGTDLFTGIEVILAGSLGDHVTGADGRQWIVGFAGDDWFDGRAGGDVFQGGAGNDTFVADTAADTMIEQAGGGNDRVLASATHFLYAGQEIERLETVSAASKAKINLFGNEFANAIVGNNGANVLDGGKGVDTLTGHGGNDTYVVDRTADAIVERKGAGKDVVVASVSYTLGKGDEIEQIQAADVKLKTPLKLTGNEYGNVVFGNAGANKLDGKGGKDTLVGGKGRDLFQLTTKPGKANVDYIQDFSTRDDRIALENGAFRKLGEAGALGADAFVAGPAALDASDRVIYDPTNGGLYYDPDGAGAAAKVLIAALTKGLAMNARDFLVI